MDKVYDHIAHEKKIYKLWEDSGAFTPQIDKNKKPYTIIMPPVNANDPLHIGHAREVATQDILIRYHRMSNYSTLWLPGTDHAGIETQFVFEKKLKEQGKSRFDYDRDTLFQMIWDYVDQNKNTVKAQLKQLGASCDWTRFKFTLDPEIVEIVYKTFKELYDRDLVYRGEQIVNYCYHCGTAYSQLEVDYSEQEDLLYYLDYTAYNSSNHKTIKIATTRPETIFADVAVAVNPNDKRYTNMIGMKAMIPIINREITIIADKLVDPEFGTGALKITPTHDKTDFEIAKRHNLPFITVIGEDGKMINTPPRFIGTKVNQAREMVVEELKREGKLVKTTEILHSVGKCYRCKSTIEPTIKKQWFILVEPLAKQALVSIKNKEVVFTAKKFEKIAKHWLKNLYDWNISRQIVWGIRIPAWRCQKCLNWVVTSGAEPTKCTKCGHTKLVQDKDTFDTWFSSGQWPYATLMTTKSSSSVKGGSKQEEKNKEISDFDYFYPTSVMDPSYDILPFWVIRMLMLGLFVTGKVPFKNVLIHGLVRDKNGIKISKSKGNVINPIEMVEKYGADALRMGLIWGSLVEHDNSLSEENIRGQRNFSNKLWNIARFISMNKDNDQFLKFNIQLKHPKVIHEDDKWILDIQNKAIKKITKLLDKQKLNEAAEELYEFIWKRFASEYLEKTKNRREEAQVTLEYVLQQSLKLAHPFLPFTTEAIWIECFNNDNQLLINSSWPTS